MRIIGIPVLLVIIFLSGCDKSRPSENGILQINAVTQQNTKGYVVSSPLTDTPGNRLHTEYEAPYRTLNLSAQSISPEGVSETFLRNESFKRSESDGVWRHEPSLYWPLGHTLNLIAYSSGKVIPEDKLAFDVLDVTSSMSITIDSSHTQDDIVFGYTGCAQSTDKITNIVMNHSQAWIEFVVNCAPGLDGKVQLDGIALDDIFTDGQLTVTHPYGYAQGKWDFRLSTASRTLVDDNMSVYGTAMTTEPVYLDMLIPEQDRKSIILYYSYRTTSELVMEHELPLSHSTWQMGKKYTYEITFNPHQITVRPSITEWTDIEGICTPE